MTSEAEEARSSRQRTLVRAAAALHVFSGVGIVVSMPLLIGVALRDGEFPVSNGIRWLSGGPFERLGFYPVLGLAAAFACLGAGEIAVATRLWRRGTKASGEVLAVNVAAIPFWIGFDLPFAPPIVAARLGLLWLARRSRGDGSADIRRGV